MSNEIKLQVPDDIILDHVRMAVGHALGTGDTPKLIEQVIRVAMTKTDYNRKPIWGAAVEQMIMKVAEETFKAWVEKNRPAIEAGISAALKKQKNALVTALVDGILESAANYRKLEVKFNVESE